MARVSNCKIRLLRVCVNPWNAFASYWPMPFPAIPDRDGLKLYGAR